MGYHVASKLSNLGHDVTILQDESYDSSKEPFKSYASLPDNVNVVVSDLASLPSTVSSTAYDYIIDNYSKSPDTPLSTTLLEKGKSAKKYVYVSSAGIYDPPKEHGGDESGPLKEAFPVKSKGQALFEDALFSSSVPLYALRPQYIYGPLANKHSYIDWYMTRIKEGKPLPIPGSGKQMASLSNAKDVASLIECCVTTEKGSPGVYNCGVSKVWGYNEVAELCGEVMGVKPNIVNYDSKDVGKGDFPFRENNFHVLPEKAVEELGWNGGDCDLKDDLKWYYEDFKERNVKGKFEKDEEILAVNA